MKYIRIELKLKIKIFLFTTCTILFKKMKYHFQIRPVTYNTIRKIVFKSWIVFYVQVGVTLSDGPHHPLVPPFPLPCPDLPVLPL